MRNLKEIQSYIKSNNTAKVAQLLPNFANKEEDDFNNICDYLIRAAIKKNNPDMVRCIIENLKPSFFSGTVLNYAISLESNLSVVKSIAPYVKPEDKLSSLYLAVTEDNKPVINLLFDLDLFSGVKEVLDYNGVSGEGVNYFQSLANNESTQKYLHENIKSDKKISKSRIF